MQHITVLQNEVLEVLRPPKDAVIVDCTLGSGGHAETIVSTLSKKSVYIAIDQDPTALESSQKRLGETKATLHFENGNFKDIKAIVLKYGYQEVDAIIADLGWRIEQFDGSSGVPRGFSFKANEPLLMTYGDPDSYSFTAYDIVNEWHEEDIANVLYAYGEERFSRRIAHAIILRREEQVIATSDDLAEVIASAVPKAYARGKTHPATKSFQALRIAVNDEFDSLTALINEGFELLKPGGRMAIITFHSLEDRIVKEHFRNLTRDQRAVLVHKKPIVPNYDEVKTNSRARSAKLRTIEKL